QKMTNRARHGAALHAAGRRDEAQALFADAERRQQERQPHFPLLYSLQGYQYCNLLLDRGEWTTVRERATQTLPAGARLSLVAIALDELSLGRAALGLALTSGGAAEHAEARGTACAARDHLDRSAAGLRATESNNYLPACLLARAALSRAIADWE